MKIHNLVPGSPEWHEFRGRSLGGASEAAAMLGLSPYVKRTELLRAKKTGLPREFSEWFQSKVLDKGHDVEALARPHMEAIVGEDLYPVTCSDGPLHASCDGLTLDAMIAAEHKQWSESLVVRMSRGEMPEEHMPQCQQVLMVTGAEKLLFVVSDGTPENMRHCWVKPDPAWFQLLRDGWAQFERDLAAFDPTDAAEPAPVGKAPESLPALRIEVTGEVTASNLAEFKATALGAIRSVNRDLKTDQDFADAAKAVQWCTDVEVRLKAAKEHALSQTASIDALFKTIDDISAEARTVRLDLAKLVERRKTEVKESAVANARKALDQHIADLNGELAPMRLLPVAADFAGAIKGLRSIASMQDALDTTLANGKIAADAQARQIRANVATFKGAAEGLEFLFADLGQIVHKGAEDFAATLHSRIAHHRIAEEARESARKKAEEDRIQAEAKRLADEAIRQAEAKRQADELAAQRAESERLAAEAELRRSTLASAQVIAQTLPEAVRAGAIEPDRAERLGGLVAKMTAEVAIEQAKKDEPATLKLGTICDRLCFTVSAQFLADVLHVKPARTDGRASLFTESQFQTICRQLQAHVGALAELYAGETA